MTVFQKGLLTILALSVLLALLAIPLLLRKVPRNPIYGFRTRSTLSDDSLWYAANAHFGRGLFAASLVTAIAIGILYRAGVSPGSFLQASVVVILAPLLVAVVATSRFIRSFRAGARPGKREP